MLSQYDRQLLWLLKKTDGKSSTQVKSSLDWTRSGSHSDCCSGKLRVQVGQRGSLTFYEVT